MSLVMQTNLLLIVKEDSPSSFIYIYNDLSNLDLSVNIFSRFSSISFRKRTSMMILSHRLKVLHRICPHVICSLLLIYMFIQRSIALPYQIMTIISNHYMQFSFSPLCWIYSTFYIWNIDRMQRVYIYVWRRYFKKLEKAFLCVNERTPIKVKEFSLLFFCWWLNKEREGFLLLLLSMKHWPSYWYS